MWHQGILFSYEHFPSKCCVAQYVCLHPRLSLTATADTVSYENASWIKPLAGIVTAENNGARWRVRLVV